jgi:hypothetical protein
MLKLMQHMLDAVEMPAADLDDLEQMLPPNWTGEPAKKIEMRRFPDDGEVLHVIGLRCTRDECGCEFVLGYRLDRHELTSGFRPCAAHEDECGLVIHALQTMEPQDVPIVKLATTMLEDNL